MTYRYRGHSVADADDTYRTKQDIQDYKNTKDPINLFEDHLIEERIVDEDTLKKINAEAKEEAERKAKEEAERKAKEEAERKAREEAERKAKEEAERKAAEALKKK